MKLDFTKTGQLTTHQKDSIREKICERNHLNKPKESCLICGDKSCGHCLGDPLHAYNKTHCPNCGKNILEE